MNDDSTANDIRLNVMGMSCNHCAAAVQGALEKVEGVSAARVDLAGGTATVTGTADPARLVAAVEAEGYRATVG